MGVTQMRQSDTRRALVQVRLPGHLVDTFFALRGWEKTLGGEFTVRYCTDLSLTVVTSPAVLRRMAVDAESRAEMMIEGRGYENLRKVAACLRSFAEGESEHETD